MCIFFFSKEKATGKLIKSFQIKCIETWCLWKIHLTFCKETKRWLKVSTFNYCHCSAQGRAFTLCIDIFHSCSCKLYAEQIN